MSPARIADQTSGALSKPGTGCGGSGLVLEPGQVHRGVELEQVGEGGEPLAVVQVFRAELELVDQRRPHLLGQARLALEADGVSHAPLAQARLDAREEVVGAAALDLELRVSRDPDGVAGDHLVAVVEERQVQANHILEQHEGVLAGRRGQGDEAGHDETRDVDDGEGGVRQERGRDRADRGHEAEGAIGQVRERMPRIDGERSHARGATRA